LTDAQVPAGIPPPIPAATVVLVRDEGARLETLMLRRNAEVTFGGMWVFPGGRVEPDDGDDEEGARRAASREAAEEAGLVVDSELLVPFAHWTPPPVAPKRFTTWFFLAPAPAGIVSIDGGEIHDHLWVTPSEALERHGAGEIQLAPPTWVTLHWLVESTSVAAALQRARTETVEYFSTRIARGEDGELVAVWHGDVAYDGGDLAAAGGRHRLAMINGGWRYERVSSGPPAGSPTG
jgi:8-oxo-dGTP pyrophosphatase MutT (NUDIX family)